MAVAQKPKPSALLVVAGLLATLQSLLWLAGGAGLVYLGVWFISKGSAALQTLVKQNNLNGVSGANLNQFVKDDIGVVSGVIFFFAAIVLIVSIICLVASIRLFKVGPVARWFIAFVEILSLLGAVRGLTSSDTASALAEIVWIVVCGVVLFILIFEPTTRHAFKAASIARKGGGGQIYATPPQGYPVAAGAAPQPAVYPPQAPVVYAQAAPAQPGYVAPTQQAAPMAPQAAYSDPSQMAQPQPAPVQPAYVDPSQMTPQQPVQPAYVDPSQMAPQQPVQPAFVDPSQMAPQQPVQPAYVDPSQMAPQQPVPPQAPLPPGYVDPNQAAQPYTPPQVPHPS